MATAKVEDDETRDTADSELNVDSSPSATTIDENEDTPATAVSSNCSILDLNQDCLLKIFSYMSMRDLSSVEKVCPHWKAVSEFLWRTFTTFDCTCMLQIQHRHLDDTFKRCLIRCGPYLKKIHFPPLYHDGKTSELLGIVARHCPYIEYAVLSETPFEKPYAKMFTKILNRLKHLEISDGEFDFSYYILKQIFKRVRQLKHLTFSGYLTKNPDLLAKAFQFLPKSVTTIHFGRLSFVDADFFRMLQKHCPNLDVLTMSCEPYAHVFTYIAKYTKLKQLEIEYCGNKIESLKHLLSLNLLEKLVLTCPLQMNDDFLEKIVESLPLLTHLDINAGFDRAVTDKGVEKLAQLKHLEHLNLSYYNLITHKGIGAVAANGKLKELILVATMVTNSVISAVLTPCHELKYLDLSACSEITEETVNTLLEIFTPTNKRSKLTVILGGTEYVIRELEKEECCEVKNLYATNLVISTDTNSVISRLRSRYDGIFDDSDDSDDFYFNDDDDDDEFYLYENEDYPGDYEFNLDADEIIDEDIGFMYIY